MGIVQLLLNISSSLDPTFKVEKYHRLLRFWGYELSNLISEEMDSVEKFKVLAWYIFEKKKIRVCEEDAAVSDSQIRIDKVINQKSAIPVSIAILFQELSYRMDLKIEFVNFHSVRMLRTIVKGRIVFFDIVNKNFLNSDEFLSFLNQNKRKGVKIKDELKVLSPEVVILNYLNALKKVYRFKGLKTNLISICNHILEYNPLNFHELGERAILHQAVGNRGKAIRDLKRYLSFVSEDKASPEVMQAHQELHQ